MFQKTKAWTCLLHFWYFVAFGISCTLCKHFLAAPSEMILRHLSWFTYFIFMFYIRRFKCSQATGAQGPNVTMLKRDGGLYFWIVHYNDHAVLAKLVSPSVPDNTYSCTG